MATLGEEIQYNAKKFFIPVVTLPGLALTGASVAGQLITQATYKALAEKPQNNPFAGVIPITNTDFAAYPTQFGTYTVTEIVFESVTYTDANNNLITTPEIHFQAILVDVTFSRNIVKETIQGCNGTAKEYIGEGDAQLTFRGVICGKNGVRPIDEIAAFYSIIKAPVPIPVANKYLNDLEIYNVVFEERSLTQDEGGYSYQPFSINAVSDVALELQIDGM